MSHPSPIATPGRPAPARRDGRRTARTLAPEAPAVVVLALWSLVPLAMTLWSSVRRYNPLMPGETGFAGVEHYRFLLTDPGLPTAILNTLLMVGTVLVVTVGLGTLLAVLFDRDFFGRGVARVLVIAPFFVMPTVAALAWKNMNMHPVNGPIGHALRAVGLRPVDWFAECR